MKLIKFRVQNFRSIIDSTWIDCNNVTNIIGVNEAGKSNALLALWKLRPANDGDINLLEDLPREFYSDLKDNCANIKFIETYFQLNDDDPLLKKLVELTGATPKELKTIYIARFFNGNYEYAFPNEIKIESLDCTELKTLIAASIDEINKITPTHSNEIKYKSAVISTLDSILSSVDSAGKNLELDSLNELKNACEVSTIPSAKSDIKPIFEKIVTEIDNNISKLDRPSLKTDAVWGEIIKAIPHFVYYSNYGNLDSEIYLPHVIDDLKRTDIGGSAAAKARTLRVLFDFINLKPTEILELGEDTPRDQNGSIITNPNEEMIAKFSKKKEERTVLLNSASAKLTREFRNWWKQGTYNFDLRADGKFFKIWVSDDKRPDKVALESRSTGLQWFLSFYLIFLVETKAHLKNSIILLDEAGLSLHPLAQRDLLLFFKSLAENNQIIHTTHSPFLVDTDNIDNVKIAYVDANGHTALSNNLRANTDPKHDTSVYAVHAALGLSVSDILLNGCCPVIVEGPSDQYYFSAIKNSLIASGKFKPQKEIVFMPAGGVKGVAAIASVISAGKELPYVIIDSDEIGKSFKSKLLKDLYKEIPDKLIEIADITKIDNTETEDIIPFSCIAKPIDKLFQAVDDFDFESIYDINKPILPQIENIAEKYSLTLSPGYKVNIAKFAKSKILALPEHHDKEELWATLFDKLK